MDLLIIAPTHSIADGKESFCNFHVWSLTITFFYFHRSDSKHNDDRGDQKNAGEDTDTDTDDSDRHALTMIQSLSRQSSAVRKSADAGEAPMVSVDTVVASAVAAAATAAAAVATGPVKAVEVLEGAVEDALKREQEEDGEDEKGE
jgi:hypothetical protein